MYRFEDGSEGFENTYTFGPHCEYCGGRILVNWTKGNVRLIARETTEHGDLYDRRHTCDHSALSIEERRILAARIFDRRGELPDYVMRNCGKFHWRTEDE